MYTFLSTKRLKQVRTIWVLQHGSSGTATAAKHHQHTNSEASHKEKFSQRFGLWWMEESAHMAVTGVIAGPLLILMCGVKIIEPDRVIATDWLMTILHFISHSAVAMGTMLQAQFMLNTFAKWDKSVAKSKFVWFTYPILIPWVIPIIAVALPNQDTHLELAIFTIQIWGVVFLMVCSSNVLFHYHRLLQLLTIANFMSSAIL
jgi:hypothetical protein